MNGRPADLLEVRDLAVSFGLARGRVQAVDGISFSIAPGETLGMVGESGSGKSVAALAILGLLPHNARIDAGRFWIDGRPLTAGSAEARVIRRQEIACIFQNPRSALNPIRSAGTQIRDVVEARTRLRGAASRARAIELLELVRIPAARGRYHAYPHELSGGMCQRVLIAMALAGGPRLLIADEPTTGLDVTTQRVIMDTLEELRRAQAMATLMITHDLGLAAAYCRQLIVMSRGRIVEDGPTRGVLLAPREPYTRRLVAATPRSSSRLRDLLPPEDPACETIADAAIRRAVVPEAAPILEANHLSKTFATDSGGFAGKLLARLRAQHGAAPPAVHAVRDVSLRLRPGGALGVVGESGSGKTTLARMLARLIDPSAGRIVFAGTEIGREPSARFATLPLRRRIQIVFQDPLGSLNPRFTVREAIANPLRRCIGRLDPAEEARRIETAMARAGLGPDLLWRFPHQLSGGQQARVGIARALVVEPEVLILDEPTSALDVSVQAVVLNRLDGLRRSLGLGFVFVSHDLNVVRLMCETVLVMRAGEVVEAGDVAQVFHDPRHPYTRELLAAIPRLPGEAPIVAACEASHA